MKFNRVLLTCDLSEESAQALRFAASRLLDGGKILILTVVDNRPIVSWPNEILPVPLESELIEDAKIKMNKICDGSLQGLQFTKVVTLSSNVAQKICDVAQEEGCDLIIMGSHGAGALANLFVGGTVQRVIKLAGCPVLVIPKELSSSRR